VALGLPAGYETDHCASSLVGMFKTEELVRKAPNENTTLVSQLPPLMWTGAGGSSEASPRVPPLFDCWNVGHENVWTTSPPRPPFSLRCERLRRTMAPVPVSYKFASEVAAYRPQGRLFPRRRRLKGSGDGSRSCSPTARLRYPCTWISPVSRQGTERKPRRNVRRAFYDAGESSRRPARYGRSPPVGHARPRSEDPTFGTLRVRPVPATRPRSQPAKERLHRDTLYRVKSQPSGAGAMASSGVSTTSHSLTRTSPWEAASGNGHQRPTSASLDREYHPLASSINSPCNQSRRVRLRATSKVPFFIKTMGAPRTAARFRGSSPKPCSERAGPPPNVGRSGAPRCSHARRLFTGIQCAEHLAHDAKTARPKVSTSGTMTAFGKARGLAGGTVAFILRPRSRYKNSGTLRKSAATELYGLAATRLITYLFTGRHVSPRARLLGVARRLWAKSGVRPASRPRRRASAEPTCRRIRGGGFERAPRRIRYFVKTPLCEPTDRPADVIEPPHRHHFFLRPRAAEPSRARPPVEALPKHPAFCSGRFAQPESTVRAAFGRRSARAKGTSIVVGLRAGRGPHHRLLTEVFARERVAGAVPVIQPRMPSRHAPNARGTHEKKNRARSTPPQFLSTR